MTDEKKTDVPFDPASLVESAFLMGIGVLELTKEKTQGLAAELKDRGKLSQSDAKKVADKLGEIAEEQQDTLRKTVAQETDKVLKTSGVATHDEIADLKAEIAELKELMAGLKPTEPAE
jgi:polyhydroxyalkanoate synthesis regulator phasin